MSLRQLNMNNYTRLGVKGLTATGTADPSIRRHKRSTFLVLDEGDLEEESGYWVMDQETGEEGFVSLFSESDLGVLAAKGDTPVEESMEEGSGNHPKAAKVKAADKVEDPASPAYQP